ncbi:hypothetical protein [Allosphingosinicella sp.]|uniref:hypothetical protein n=1 Tax=Allosphingosinicella sp. TaxID=2823234 RepID=UPI003D71362B
MIASKNPAPQQILFCGFGQVSEASAQAFIRRRFPVDRLSALTDKACRYDAARALGVDATQIKALTAASIVDHVGSGTAQLMVDVGDDTRLVRMLLLLKQHRPEMKVAAVAVDPSVSRTLSLHGMSDLVCIPQLAGLLLAQSVIQPPAKPRRLQ